MTCCVLSLKLHKQMTDTEKVALAKQLVPCPACDDVLVVTDDVSRYVHENYPDKASEALSLCGDSTGEPNFAFCELGDDRFAYVLNRSASSRFDARGDIELRLEKLLPSFDSIAVWRAFDGLLNEYTVCIHFPVSSLTPIPDCCVPYMEPCDTFCRSSAITVQVYNADAHLTLRQWCAKKGQLDPRDVLKVLEKLSSALDDLSTLGYDVMRITPDTIAMSDDRIRLMGLISVGLPWNERCVEAYQLVELASIAPECRGFICQFASPRQTVYALASIAYYLVAGTLPQTCAALDYEPSVMPRAYHPEFPIGFDEAILDGLSASPDERTSNVDVLMHGIEKEEDLMQRRAAELSRIRAYEASGKSGCGAPWEGLCYDAAVDTHVGIAKVLRCPVNQDSVWLAQSADAQRLLVVVGDGVSTSTYGSGDIASQILVQTAEELWHSSIEKVGVIDPKSCVGEILETANARICRYIQEHFGNLNPLSSECMGTTAIVALIEHGVLTLGASGDSRAYIVRSDAMHCITRDHNLYTVGLLNYVPVDVCATHPHAGSLVQCLGYNVDESGVPCKLEFDLYEMALIDDDHLLITTDGILDYVACDLGESEQIIGQVIRQVGNAEGICKELIMQANLGGGGDNCGVAIVCVHGGAIESGIVGF